VSAAKQPLPAALTRPIDDQVAFIGAISASVTHELTNVIAIIDQNGGLLQDLIAGEERGVPLSLDRLTTVSATLQKQTRRGLEIIQRLNRFAHSGDSTATGYQLQDTLENVIELTRRLANLRDTSIAFQSPETAVNMVGSPIALQRAVFETLRVLLREGSPGSEIRVAVEARPDTVTIDIASSSGWQLLAENVQPIEAALVDLPSAEVSTDSTGPGITLLLPRVSPSASED